MIYLANHLKLVKEYCRVRVDISISTFLGVWISPKIKVAVSKSSVCTILPSYVMKFPDTLESTFVLSSLLPGVHQLFSSISYSNGLDCFGNPLKVGDNIVSPRGLHSYGLTMATIRAMYGHTLLDDLDREIHHSAAIKIDV